MGPERRQAFAVWITGLPASGKSTVTQALKTRLGSLAIDVAVLESDELRKVFTPDPRYDERERDTFYRQMVYVGTLLVAHGVPVVFDATANRRVWREDARRAIPRFVEVFVDSPLDVCIARDPKGIYRQARLGGASSVPGLQSAYEAPEHPDVVVDGSHETADFAARNVIAKLMEKGFIPSAGQ